MPNRARDRQGFSEENRLRLLESDCDGIDEAIEHLRADFNKQMDDVRSQNSKILLTLVGLLITVTTAVIVYGLTNIASGGKAH